MSTDTTKVRSQVLRRLQAGEKVRVVAASAGLSDSTVYRWQRESRSTAAASTSARRPRTKRTAAVAVPVEGYLGDITGPGITDGWGVTGTDLGVCAVAPNGNLVSVFGDTFSGDSVGQGD